MAGIIIEGGVEAATNADILNGTRLLTVPESGLLTFEIQAADGIAANSFVFTITLPDGDVPCIDVPAPANSVTAGVPGVINSEDKFMASFPITKGGHTVFSCVETGDTEFSWRVTYTPIL